MQINLITLGKLKETYLKQASQEYEKRLSAFCKLKIIEIEPVRLPENPSDTLITTALQKEAELIKKHIKSGSFSFAMCIEGEQMSSESLAERIEKIGVGGIDTVNFIIGSSHGLANEIKSNVNFKMSMSKMTFPHQLARIMMLEQIYRAFSITSGSKYHK